MDILAREEAQNPKSPSGKKHFRILIWVAGEI
jgi:hypothetical protein